MSALDRATAPVRVRATFTGKGRDIFCVEGLKMLLWYLSGLGIPLGWLYTLRWLCRNISLPSGATVSFTGTAAPAYGFFLPLLVLSIALDQFEPKASGMISKAPLVGGSVFVAWILVQTAGNALLYGGLYKWICAHVVFSSGTRLAFKGRPGSCVKWGIVYVLSFFTIVGWAWVHVAVHRWIVRETDLTGRRLTLRVDVLGFLWRTVIAVVATLFILPIPWMVAWLCRWAIENIEAESVPRAARGPRR
jgi:hypothetical protein